MKDIIPVGTQVAEQATQTEDGQRSKNSFSLPLAIIETCLIIAGLLAIAVLLPHSMVGKDERVRFEGISQLIEHHTLSAMPYSYIGPLFSIPFWLLGRHYKNIVGWIEQYNLFVFTCGLLVSYLLLRNRIDRGILRKFFLLLIAASMFARHLTAYYGEVFTAVLVGVGIIAIVVSSAASLYGWLAIILGVVNTPASLVGLGLVVLQQAVENRRLRYILAFVVAIALILGEAWLRRGGPFVSGYETATGASTVMPFSGRPGFSYPFLFGLLSILLSFGKGLLFFAPGLVLPIKGTLLRIQQERKIDLWRIYFLWLAFLVGLILVYSRWWSWYGGWFWGPRFFLFASIPASFALAVRVQKRDASLLVNLLTSIVLCLSAWVGIDGAIFDQTQIGQVCTTNHYALEMLCYYTPDFSALWHPFIVPQHFTQQQLLYMAYCGIVFLYLALPLFIKLVSQVVELVGNLGRVYLNIGMWRF